MSLTEKDVLRAAELARLEIRPDEVQSLVPQVKETLSYVRMLDRVDTENVEPMSFAIERKNAFRPDIPGGCLLNEEALSNSADSGGGHFLVPRVIE